MYDLMLILVSGWQRAHVSIVKTAMTFGMDIARVMPPRTKMAVGGEGSRDWDRRSLGIWMKIIEGRVRLAASHVANFLACRG